MNKVRISIKDFFKKKVSEEKTETTETTTADETTETKDDDSTDEGGEADDEETTETESTESQTTESTGAETTASEQGEQVQVKEMTLEAFEALQRDAKSWNDNKDRLAALVQWEAAIKGVGGKGASVDQNIQNGKKTAGILDQPWNKAAVEAAAVHK
jgi:hypothetical protein